MRKAIVMAGGQGSRLWPLTLTRPKPLVPVANQPVIAHILHWLRGHGFSEVLVTLHYRANDIRRALREGPSFGLTITYEVEDEPLGTAGCVKAAEHWIAGEPFLIASGDALTDVDLTALQRKHRESGAWLTLGLKRVHDPSHFGVVEVANGGSVVRFQEKPGPGRAFSNLVNTGIYCIEPQVLTRVPRGRAADWSHEIFPLLLAEGQPLYGHELHGYWRDIGSLREYYRGQQDFLAGAIHMEAPAIKVGPHLWVGVNAHMAPGAVVKGPALLGAGCRIEPEALILPGSMLGAGTVVHRGACIAGAILGAGCVVGSGALLRDCIVDDEVEIGPHCVVQSRAVVGRGCYLEAGAQVSAGRRIEPSTVLPDPPPPAWAATRQPLPVHSQRKAKASCATMIHPPP
jgi:mannose-1-phosphate guanylyltransferase / phosphomannomutase